MAPARPWPIMRISFKAITCINRNLFAGKIFSCEVLIKMKPKRIFGTLLFITLVGFVWLWAYWKGKSGRISPASVQTVMDVHGAREPRKIQSGNSFYDVNLSFPFPDFSDTDLDLMDITLGFAKLETAKEFARKASMNGFEVLGQIPGLGTIKVRIIDFAKATKALAALEEDFELARNPRVRLPTLPDTQRIVGEKGFGDQAFDWLGAPKDRKHWGDGIKVAILDSGIDAGHPLLNGASIERIKLVDDHEKSFLGHGTAIASIIGGQLEGSLGLAPSASILSIEVLDQFGEGDAFTVAKGVVEATDRGSDLINLSLGGDFSSPVLESAVAYAREKGVLVVAAVGNEGIPEVAYPARYEGVIGVTAVDLMGRPSAFANYGDGVDVSAPGVQVNTAWEEDEIVSFSGTSGATAFVSGALVAEMSKNPHLTEAQLVDVLYGNANELEKPGFDEWTGHGVLSVGRMSNRNIEGIADAAIVGYYFDPEDLKGGGTTPFLVTVQNQGTTWLNNMNLQVIYKGIEKEYLINNLSPGETRSERLYVEGSQASKPLSIYSKVQIEGQEDRTPENNIRRSTLELPGQK